MLTASAVNSKLKTTPNKPSRKQKHSVPPVTPDASNENTRLIALAEQMAHLGSWEYDITMPTSLWSPELFRIFGIEPRLRGMTMEEYRGYIHPDDLAFMNQRMDLLLNSSLHHKETIDYRIIRRDGAVRIIHSQRQVKQVTTDGKPKIIVGVEQDVTEQIAAEEALRKSEERFRIVAEAAHVMVYEVEFPLRTIRFISGIEELTGYKPNEVGDSTDWVYAHMHPEDADFLTQKFPEIVADKTTDHYSIEYRIRHKNGNYIIVKDTGKLIKDYTGKTILMVGGVRDITQRRSDQEKIRQYNKHLEQLVEERTNKLLEYERLAAMGQIAGMVGHDIRNPLQALIGEVFLIKSDLEGIPEGEAKTDLQESLVSIEQNIAYINKIVADLQDYSRQLNPEYRMVDLEDLIVKVFETIIIPKNVELTFDIKSLPNLRCDPTFIRRILTNLINNAIQAMPNGGNLEIEGYPEQNQVSIVVSDTGIGIADELKPKLFNPMFTTKTKGQGLGLAVVKRLIEAQGGSIGFDSKLGHGTKFYIKLPLVQN